MERNKGNRIQRQVTRTGIQKAMILNGGSLSNGKKIFIREYFT